MGGQIDKQSYKIMSFFQNERMKSVLWENILSKSTTLNHTQKTYEKGEYFGYSTLAYIPRSNRLLRQSCRLSITSSLVARFYQVLNGTSFHIVLVKKYCYFDYACVTQILTREHYSFYHICKKEKKKKPWSTQMYVGLRC